MGKQTDSKIKGGYIIQPRVIQESDISVAPPYVREIWAYLIREANSCDNKYNGHEIKRGQLFRSYNDIKEGTKWYVGWRKMTYHENHMKKAMKFLRDTERITSMKEPGGVLITICKYDYYQDPKNYERPKESTKEGTIAEPELNQTLPYNNKNNKNDKNNKNKEESGTFVPPTQDQVIEYFTTNGYRKDAAIRYFEYYREGKWRDGSGKKLVNWKQKARSVWFRPEYQIEETAKIVFPGKF